MMTQSRIDCKKILVDKYGLDEKTSEFVDIWDLHYKHEDGLPFEEELMNKIKEHFPDKDHQEIYDLVLEYFEDAKRRRRFFQRGNPRGYGYEVIKRDNGSYKLMLHTYDEQKAKDYWEALRQDPEAKAPDTSEEIPPTRILYINDKYGPFYYQANTETQFKKKALEFIMCQVQNNVYYPPQATTEQEALGMTEEEINKLPEGKIKERAKQELAFFKKELGYINKHVNTWAALDRIKQNKDDISKVRLRDLVDVLNFYQGDEYEGNWRIIDPQ